MRPLVLASVIAALILSTVPALALAATATVTQLRAVNPTQPVYGQDYTLQAYTETWIGGDAYGTLSIYDLTSGSEVLLVSQVVGAFPNDTVTLTMSGQAVGDHTFRADFHDADTYADSTKTEVVTVSKATPKIVLSAPSNIETNHSWFLDGSIQTLGVDEAGTLTITQDGVATPVCSYAASSNYSFSCEVPNLPAGSYSFTVEYSGSANVNPNSKLRSLTVVPDVVHVHGVGIQYGTFYPVNDGYRDADKISGVREEPASVSIRITNGNGNVVKSTSIPMDNGSYAFKWNGRNSSGNVLPEGTYTVKQKVIDGAGNDRTFLDEVQLSKKHLVIRTTTITKRGSALAASGRTTDASVRINDTAHFVKLNVPFGDWAGVGWQFAIPSAVEYRWIQFRVYAKHGLEVNFPTRMGMQDMDKCAFGSTWNESCFNGWHGVGNQNGTLRWYSTSQLDSSHLSDLRARGIVSSYGGSTYVYKAQVIVRYGVLRY